MGWSLAGPREESFQQCDVTDPLSIGVERFFDPFPTCLAELAVHCWLGQQFEHALSQSIHVVGGDEIAGFAVDDRLGSPADASTDNGEFGGHVFQPGIRHPLGL